MTTDNASPATEGVVHDLKCTPKFFEEVLAGRKPFEIRYNDRDYAVGHKLRLREWTDDFTKYSGREITKTVGYMTDFQQQRGYVVMGFAPEPAADSTLLFELRETAAGRMAHGDTPYHLKLLARAHAALVSFSGEPGGKQLTFTAFSAANLTRCLKWHPAGINSWSTSDWLTAVTGELGELASLIKMRNRERDGLPGNKFSPTDKQIADEIADVFCYLDLLATSVGVNLAQAVVSKFNEVSDRVGFPDKL